MPLPAFVVPLLGGIARAGASMFGRQGIKSVAKAAAGQAKSFAAKGAAGVVGRVSAGQNVLEGASWQNARMMTKALDLAKRGGGTVRQIFQKEEAQKASKGTQRAAAAAKMTGSPAGAAIREGRKGLSGESRKTLNEYLKSLRKGSISDRHRRLTEAGDMLPITSVPKDTGELYPSKKKMVQHSERELVRAKQRELQRQERETQKKSFLNSKLARTTTLLITGPSSFLAAGKAIDRFTKGVEANSSRLEIWSGLIASEMHLTKLTQLFADMRTARMTESSFAGLASSRRRVINAWQRPGAETTKLLNTVSGWANNVIAVMGEVVTGIIKTNVAIADFMGLVAADQQEGQMPQQQFRNYWAAMAAGNWEKELPPIGANANPVVNGPLAPPVAGPLVPGVAALEILRRVGAAN